MRLMPHTLCVFLLFLAEYIRAGLVGSPPSCTSFTCDGVPSCSASLAQAQTCTSFSGSLQLQNAAVNFNFPVLTTIDNTLYVADVVGSLSFPVLQSVYYSAGFYRMNGSLDFPNLKSSRGLFFEDVGAIGAVTLPKYDTGREVVARRTNITSIDLPVLTSTTELTIEENLFLQRFYIPAVTTSTYFTLGTNPLLYDVHFGQETITGNLILEGFGTPNISFSNLVTLSSDGLFVPRFAYNQEPRFVSSNIRFLLFPKLKIITGTWLTGINFEVDGAANIEEMHFPALESFEGIKLKGLTKLRHFHLPALKIMSKSVIGLYNCDVLETFRVPAGSWPYTAFMSGISVQGCPQLHTMDFGNMTTFPGPLSFWTSPKLAHYGLSNLRSVRTLDIGYSGCPQSGFENFEDATQTLTMSSLEGPCNMYWPKYNGTTSDVIMSGYQGPGGSIHLGSLSNFEVNGWGASRFQFELTSYNSPKPTWNLSFAGVLAKGSIISVYGSAFVNVTLTNTSLPGDLYVNYQDARVRIIPQPTPVPNAQWEFDPSFYGSSSDPYTLELLIETVAPIYSLSFADYENLRISAPYLEEMGYSLGISRCGVPFLDLPKLRKLPSLQVNNMRYAPGRTWSLEFPRLSMRPHVWGVDTGSSTREIRIENNRGLTSLSFPEVTFISYLTLNVNPDLQLNNVAFPNLTTVEYLQMQDNGPTRDEWGFRAFPLLVSDGYYPQFYDGQLDNRGICADTLLNFTARLLRPAYSIMKPADSASCPPRIASIAPLLFPSSGGLMQLSGTRFGATAGSITAVIDGLLRECALVSWTETFISCTWPAGSGLELPIFVVNKVGVRADPAYAAIALLSYAPVINALDASERLLSGVWPVSALAAGGALLTLRGTDFGLATGSATVGGTACAVQSWSNTVVVCTLPSGTGNSTVSVQVQRVLHGAVSNQVAFHYVPVIHGTWSAWSVWSATCGNRTRTRACNNPVASGGGSDCVGSTVESEDLATCVPVVHGGWSLWSAWSATCGVTFRTRACNNPLPSGGGQPCIGDSVQVTDAGACVPVAVPVHGNWSAWSAWSATCGLATRMRLCDNPTPSNGGNACVGPETEQQQLAHCNPVHGGWSVWSAWSATCGAAARLRTCDNPVPNDGGQNCTGASLEGRDRGSCEVVAEPIVIKPAGSSVPPAPATSVRFELSLSTGTGAPSLDLSDKNALAELQTSLALYLDVDPSRVSFVAVEGGGVYVDIADAASVPGVKTLMTDTGAQAVLGISLRSVHARVTVDDAFTWENVKALPHSIPPIVCVALLAVWLLSASCLSLRRTMSESKDLGKTLDPVAYKALCTSASQSLFARFSYNLRNNHGFVSPWTADLRSAYTPGTRITAFFASFTIALMVAAVAYVANPKGSAAGVGFGLSLLMVALHGLFAAAGSRQSREREFIRYLAVLVAGSLCILVSLAAVTLLAVKFHVLEGDTPQLHDENEVSLRWLLCAALIFLFETLVWEPVLLLALAVLWPLLISRRGGQVTRYNVTEGRTSPPSTPASNEHESNKETDAPFRSADSKVFNLQSQSTEDEQTTAIIIRHA